MRYFVLATDFDGTLATDGLVSEKTLDALERLKNSGRKLIMVTGRELDQLIQVFPQINMFDRVVAENGALLYKPATNEEKLLCENPHDKFVAEIQKRGVHPVSVGRCIVATWKPHENTVLEVIRDMGLELQVIFNKDAVMVLPSGVNKATGMNVALKDLGISHHNVVGIGDAENDHAFLKSCEFSVAVNNALPMLKERADLVTSADHGSGVTELIEKILKNDLENFNNKIKRHQISIGMSDTEKETTIKPYGESIMVAGVSGGGKTGLSVAFIESLIEMKYQYCIIDPEGDYDDLETAVMQGSAQHPPQVGEIIKILEIPRQNCVVNMVGISVEDRPEFFKELLPALLDLRKKTGRPHWIIADEAHHFLPANWDFGNIAFPEELKNILYITVTPDHVSEIALQSVDSLILIGHEYREAMESFCKAKGVTMPSMPDIELKKGDALFWNLKPSSKPFVFAIRKPELEQRRHRLKYAQGELGNEGSFYFRGPKNKLNLRVQNLMIFIQISEGVDDDTWCYHLYRGDYSRWFRDVIKNPELAWDTENIERDQKLTAKESRERIKQLIQDRYTAPA